MQNPTLPLCVQGMMAGFGPCKQPLPGYSLERSGVHEYGAMGDLDDLMASIPEVRVWGRDREREERRRC